MRLRRLEQDNSIDIYDQGDLVIARNVHLSPSHKKRLWILVAALISIAFLVLYILNKGVIDTIGTLTIPVIEISSRNNVDVLSIHCVEGQTILSKDTLLVVRESSTITRRLPDSLETIRSEVLLREEALRVNLALKELQRKEQLLALDLIVAQEVEKARAEHQLAVARLEKKRIELKRERLKEKLPVENPISIIRAPSNAIVGRILKQKGEVAKTGEVILTLLDTEHPWVETIVPEKVLNKLFIGQAVTLQPITSNAEPFIGHVRNIGAVVDIMPESYQYGNHTPEKGVVVKLFTQPSHIASLKPGSSLHVKFHRQ